MTHALQEQVDPDQASARIFHHVDEMAAKPAHVQVDVRTYGGSAFLLSAGGPPPRAWDGPEPPFTHYEVQFSESMPLPWLPRVWQRYLCSEELVFLLVPKLLISHLIFATGGLLQATFMMSDRSALQNRLNE